MLPAYKPNDYVVCLKTKKIKANDVIIMQTDDLGKVVKRVKSISGNSLTILGDNKSYHSPVYDKTHKLDTVIGKVVFKLF
jgi:phage repressor protein C with HTH and peptisase S24 domain